MRTKKPKEQLNLFRTGDGRLEPEPRSGVRGKSLTVEPGEGIMSTDGRYLRLVDGKVVYITEEEAMQEEVLATPDDKLGEWAKLVQEAEKIKERAGYLHQAMRDDDQRPSQFEPDYRMLWYRYQEVAYKLRQIDSRLVDEFEVRVVLRVLELKDRLNVMSEVWNPDDFEDFEELLALYEKNYDLMEVLGDCRPDSEK